MGSVEPGFWDGRRVLITGHTGFKGAWLCEWLLDLGAEVTGLSFNVPTDPSLFELLGLRASVRHVEGDVRDARVVQSTVAEAHPEVVLHLAAQSLVRPSYDDPVSTFATNVMGTVHVLEAVRTADVAVTLVVTSDKCYDNREWPWGYRENDRLGGHDPYSSSKACAELVTAAYRARSLVEGGAGRIASARAGNVIGGGDWSVDRLVPDIARAALVGEAVQLRNPGAVRPWQHVLDCLSGYLVLAQRLWDDPAAAGAWNFGPDVADQRTALELAQQLISRWPEPVAIDAAPGPHAHEAAALTLDSSRARAELGWRPSWSVDEALERVVEWYVTYSEQGDIAEVTRMQIAQHQGRTDESDR